MKIFCPNCALAIEIDSDLIGNKGLCPNCSHKFIVDDSHRQPPTPDDLGTAPTIKMDDDAYDDAFGEVEESWLTSPAFRVAMFGMLALLFTAGISFWLGSLEKVPTWAAELTKLHEPLAYGSLMLVVMALLMEGMGYSDRYEHLRNSLTFVLWITFIVLALSNISGAFVGAGAFGPHWWLSFAAGAAGIGALATSIVADDRPVRSRSAILLLIVLTLGCLIVAAWLGAREAGGRDNATSFRMDGFYPFKTCIA